MSASENQTLKGESILLFSLPIFLSNPPCWGLRWTAEVRKRRSAAQAVSGNAGRRRRLRGMTPTAERYDASHLHDSAFGLLVAAGMPDDKAEAVAGILVDGDLLGHTTHGLQLLPSYLREVGSGSMNVEGQPHVVHE